VGGGVLCVKKKIGDTVLVYQLRHNPEEGIPEPCGCENVKTRMAQTLVM